VLDRVLEIGAAMEVDLVAAPRERAAERDAGIDVAGRPDRGDDDMQDFASSSSCSGPSCFGLMAERVHAQPTSASHIPPRTGYL